MIPTLWHSEKGRTTEAVKTCMLPGVRGREGEEQVEHRIFLGRETVLYDAVTVDACIYTFIKTQRMYDTE